MKVWDPVVRLLHWTLAALIVFDLVNDDGSFTHRMVGYSAAAVVLLRLTRAMIARGHGSLVPSVPAALISTPGALQVMARTNDGKLYSNSSILNVTPPPLPNYNFVGIIGKPRGNDTAVLQKKGDKELLNVYRGDVLEGRFRVNSISEREVVLVDTTLKIRHTIPFTVDSSIPPQNRPPVRRVDDEP